MFGRAAAAESCAAGRSTVATSPSVLCTTPPSSVTPLRSPVKRIRTVTRSPRAGFPFTRAPGLRMPGLKRGSRRLNSAKAGEADKKKITKRKKPFLALFPILSSKRGLMQTHFFCFFDVDDEIEVGDRRNGIDRRPEGDDVADHRADLPPPLFDLSLFGVVDRLSRPDQKVDFPIGPIGSAVFHFDKEGRVELLPIR